MTEDTLNNKLWTITPYGGINAIDLITGNIIYTYSFKKNDENFINHWLKCIQPIDTMLWVGTFDGLAVFNIISQKKEWVSPLPFQKKGGHNFNIDLIHKDDDQNIWVFVANYGLAVYSGKTRQLLGSMSLNEMHLKESNEIKQFNSVNTINNRSLIVGTNEGITEIRFTSEYKLSITKDNSKYSSYFKNGGIYYSKMDDDSSLWISSAIGTFKFPAKEQGYTRLIINTQEKGENYLENVNCLFIDKQKNIWIGTPDGILIISNKSVFTFYNRDKQSNLQLSRLYALYANNDSIVYACDQNGLFEINTFQNRFRLINDQKEYYCIEKNKDNNFLISNNNGFQVYTPGSKIHSVDKIYPELTLLKDELINTILQLNDSITLLGSEKVGGFYMWNRISKKITMPLQNAQLSGDKYLLNTIYKLDNNSALILSDNALLSYNNLSSSVKEIELLNPFTNTPLNVLMDICKTKDHYWIAAYGTGIVKLTTDFKIEKIYTETDGLSNSGLYKIFQIKGEKIIATSNNGLMVLNIPDNKIRTYYQQDGLHSSIFEEGCGEYVNDKIYVGGIGGFTIIRPDELVSNKWTPRLYFGNISIKTSTGLTDTSNLNLKAITIPSNVSQTTIFFSTINFSNPEGTIVKYKLKEQGDDWIDLGKNYSFSLVGLSPGKYHLQAQAFNEDGGPSEIKTLTLIFMPQWYQTWWFKVVLLLAIVAAIYGLYRSRINQLRKEEKIRNQVAGDLHDELGSTLNSVKIFTNLALMEKENRSHLEKIKEATQSAISGVKDIIWVLDDKRDTLDHLLGRINQFARPICEAAGISYKQQSGGNENYKLGKEEKRNLYMIIKESINNSIKYADCSVIELLIKNNGGKLNISISDNGKGFDREKIASGYGLRNIIHRSTEIEYHAEINSSPGNGTLIYLEKK